MDYQERFFRHVARFLAEHCPHAPKPVVVAVSGGVDSMALLAFAVWAKTQGIVSSVRVLSVHHHTRDGQDQEMAFVQRSAEAQGLNVQVLHREALVPQTNIEHVLRLERLTLLKEALRPGEQLWLGQHLNDSWEWAQIQQARSSTVRGSLGIPLIHGVILRPFLCVTRSQIERLAQKLDLRWCEDPTNQDERFARQAWRLRVAPWLQGQHPQYLKHYARRSQRLAEALGCALKKPSRRRKIFVQQKAALIHGWPGEEVMAQLVARYSKTGRGTLAGELLKLARAFKAKKRGPHRLSGGVEVHLWGEWLLLTAAGFAFKTTLQQNWRWWRRDELICHMEKRWQEEGSLSAMPWWVGIDLTKNRFNILVAAGRDPHWAGPAIPHMSVFKLLARWQRADCPLWLAV